MDGLNSCDGSRETLNDSKKKMVHHLRQGRFSGLTAGEKLQVPVGCVG